MLPWRYQFQERDRMIPYIHAEKSSELYDKARDDLGIINHPPRLQDPAWSERVQMAGTLRFGAEHDWLKYPIELFHTSDRNPDFKLSMGGRTIGVEASRVTSEALHRLQHLHHSGETA